MAFDLKRVLKVMLFASDGALSVKDIQTAIGRFHEQATALPLVEPDGAAAPTEAGEEAPGSIFPAQEDSAPLSNSSGGSAGPLPGDDEFYHDVPSLVTTTQIREAMEIIAAKFRAADDGIVVVEGPTGWRLATHSRYARWVRLLRNEPPPVRLSPSSLETLAVVAYRQPVTRAEIESVRGVSADAGLTKLLERDLVQVVGRADLPGRPIQYGTTEIFLEFVGIKSIDELPASDVLSPRQIDAWLQSANQPRPAGDADMGLDESGENQLSLDQAGSPGAAVAEPAPASTPSL